MNPKGRPSKKPASAEHLAQRLHDTLAQELAACGLLAYILAEELEKEKRPEAAQANTLLEKLNAASRRLHEVTQEFATSGGKP